MQRAGGGEMLAAIGWQRERVGGGVWIATCCWRRLDGVWCRLWLAASGLPVWLAASKWQRVYGGVMLAGIGWQRERADGGVWVAAYGWRRANGGK
jgi:hypothetical protein